jgi:hypothetical protein
VFVLCSKQRPLARAYASSMLDKNKDNRGLNRKRSHGYGQLERTEITKDYQTLFQIMQHGKIFDSEGE